MTQWYEKLFNNYARTYDNENFVQGTSGECDFLEKESGYDKSLKILDIGCGTGRHAIELTKRGYLVTGVDLSSSQLAYARQKAAEERLEIDFQQHDARNLPFDREFDLAIMLCEGGFPLMETDEMNYDILKSATRSLKGRGKLIFTTLNGLFPIHSSIEDFCAQNTEEGNARYTQNHFDWMTFRDHNLTVVNDDDNNPVELQCNERYYIPPEITWLLKSLGFDKVAIYGAKIGAYSRNDALSSEDFEMLVIAEKI